MGWHGGLSEVWRKVDGECVGCDNEPGRNEVVRRVAGRVVETVWMWSVGEPVEGHVKGRCK